MLTAIMNYRNSGLEVKSYRYYDPKTCGFDAAGAYEDLNVSWLTQLDAYYSVSLIVSFTHWKLRGWGVGSPYFL